MENIAVCEPKKNGGQVPRPLFSFLNHHWFERCLPLTHADNEASGGDEWVHNIENSCIPTLNNPISLRCKDVRQRPGNTLLPIKWQISSFCKEVF